MMPSHEIDYKIIGDAIQIVEIELDPEETVVAEAGAMMYMTENIDFQTKLGDGSDPSEGFFNKLISVGSRILSGESAFMTHFTYKGASGKGHVAFAAPYPGTIVPLDLSEAPGNEIIVQKDAFLCAAKGTRISVTFNKRLGSGLVGGEGFILQKIQGDGRAFIHAGGTIVERQLNNSSIAVDTGCVVGFENTVDFNIQRSGGVRSMLFGGEGLFLAKLSGTGKVWLQSMPIRKLVQALSPYGINQKGGASRHS